MSFLSHRKLVQAGKTVSIDCHDMLITLINHCSRTLPYCLCDEVAIDATSLIDSCATQSVPVDGEAVVATQAQAAVDGKAVVVTQAQAVLLSCRWQKVMSPHHQCGEEERICGRRQMQFVGGHKFWPSCSSVVCLCQSLRTPFCSTVHFSWLTGGSHVPSTDLR